MKLFKKKKKASYLKLYSLYRSAQLSLKLKLPQLKSCYTYSWLSLTFITCP